jgi:hypothetical protein
MTDRTYLVAEIKAQLEAQGQTWRTNEDAAQITWRVAWACRREGAMLIVKRPEQNGAVYQGVKFSHDALAFPEGWIDCLVSAGPPRNVNGPTWGATGTDPSAPLALPFDLDAELFPDNNPIVLPPIDPPPPDAVAIALQALTDEIRHLHALLTAKADALMLDERDLQHRYDNIAGYLARLEATQARGLKNRIIGAVSVVPAP